MITSVLTCVEVVSVNGLNLLNKLQHSHKELIVLFTPNTTAKFSLGHLQQGVWNAKICDFSHTGTWIDRGRYKIKTQHVSNNNNTFQRAIFPRNMTNPSHLLLVIMYFKHHFPLFFSLFASIF